MGCFKIPESYFSPLEEKKEQHFFGDNYYPFGLTFNSYQRVTSKQNDFLYNGKELQDELDLNWLDYGARMYDPAIGRWHVVDPMTSQLSSISPYNYVYNNPISFVDPTGMFPDLGNPFFENEGNLFDYPETMHPSGKPGWNEYNLPFNIMPDDLPKRLSNGISSENSNCPTGDCPGYEEGVSNSTMILDEGPSITGERIPYEKKGVSVNGLNEPLDIVGHAINNGLVGGITKGEYNNFAVSYFVYGGLNAWPLTASYSRFRIQRGGEVIISSGSSTGAGFGWDFVSASGGNTITFNRHVLGRDLASIFNQAGLITTQTGGAVFKGMTVTGYRSPSDKTVLWRMNLFGGGVATATLSGERSTGGSFKKVK